MELGLFAIRCRKCMREKPCDEKWPHCEGCRYRAKQDEEDEDDYAFDLFGSAEKTTALDNALYCPQCWAGLQQDPLAYPCRSSCCKELEPSELPIRCSKDCLFDGYYCTACNNWGCVFSPRLHPGAFVAVCGACGGQMDRLDTRGVMGLNVPLRCLPDSPRSHCCK